MTERDIQRGIMQAFRAAGWKVWRLQAGTARGGRTHLAEAGAPDLVCLGHGGRVVFVECKKLGEKMRESQIHVADWCDVHGQEYTVMDCVEDVEEVL